MTLRRRPPCRATDPSGGPIVALQVTQCRMEPSSTSPVGRSSGNRDVLLSALSSASPRSRRDSSAASCSSCCSASSSRSP